MEDVSVQGQYLIIEKLNGYFGLFKKLLYGRHSDCLKKHVSLHQLRGIYVSFIEIEYIMPYVGFKIIGVGEDF